MKRIFYFFRHGQTDWNLNHRFQGHTDIPLNQNGREHAERLAQLLTQLDGPIETIYSSDLRRACETAEYVATNLQLKVHRDRRLRELHMGKLQGMTRSEVARDFGDTMLGAALGTTVEDEQWCYPEGESVAELNRRVGEFMRDILNKEERVVAISTHGGVLRRYLSNYVKNQTVLEIPNCVVYRLEVENGEYQLIGPYLC